MSELKNGKTGITLLLRQALISVPVLGLLLLFSAALGNEIAFIQNSQVLVSKSCLCLAAVLCGLLCAGKAGEKKLRSAMMGESVLLAALLVLCILCGKPLLRLSMAIDLLILAFGGFAGAILESQRKIKRKRRK